LATGALIAVTHPSEARWVDAPFTIGTAEEFARLRELLVRLKFTELDICAAAGMSVIYELKSLETRTNALLDRSDPQALLVQLFIDGEEVPWSVVRSTLAPADIALIEKLGLLRSSIRDADQCTASVALYPNEKLYIASDKHANIEAVATGIPSDIVFSALTPETHLYVELMPRVRCKDYLELCSGTGVAALIAGRDFAEHAWAVDITERSTLFALFNAALNGLTNITALAGDLYEPLAGKTFDLIVAHPPYVPAFETTMVFRDGGEDGEQVTRRILAGLADHLRPGGQFYCECMMTDRVGAPLETRIREMLGPAATEFDVLLGQSLAFDPEDYLVREVRAKGFDADALGRRREVLERLGIERLVSTAFLLQRRESQRTVVTSRRIVSSDTTANHYQWYLRWAVATADWTDAASRLLDTRPRRAQGVEMQSRSVFRATGWSVVESTLITRTPFALEANCPAWFATLLTWCDGEMTAREHLKHLRDIGVIPDSASDAEFAVLIGQLADGGFVELDQFPFPIA
jgi:methylase of polypeptide subunit release factors